MLERDWDDFLTQCVTPRSNLWADTWDYLHSAEYTSGPWLALDGMTWFDAEKFIVRPPLWAAQNPDGTWSDRSNVKPHQIPS
jgi:hypothetical protein